MWFVDYSCLYYQNRSTWQPQQPGLAVGRPTFVISPQEYTKNGLRKSEIFLGGMHLRPPYVRFNCILEPPFSKNLDLLLIYDTGQIYDQEYFCIDLLWTQAVSGVVVPWSIAKYLLCCVLFLCVYNIITYLRCILYPVILYHDQYSILYLWTQTWALYCGRRLTVNPGKHISWMLVLPSMAAICVPPSDMCSGEHISLGKYVRGHTFPGGTHITVTLNPKVTHHMECLCYFPMS